VCVSEREREGTRAREKERERVCVCVCERDTNDTCLQKSALVSFDTKYEFLIIFECVAMCCSVLQ